MRKSPFVVRRHHYDFAHVALPSLVQQHRLKMLGAFVNEHATDFLHHIWQQVGAHLPQSDRLNPDGLSCSLHDCNECAIVVITLPKPTCITEAHFTAIVFAPFTNVIEALDSLPYRYFTLEFNGDMQGNDVGAIMCEWREGAHYNFGGRLPGLKDAFFEAIKSLIS